MKILRVRALLGTLLLTWLVAGCPGGNSLPLLVPVPEMPTNVQITPGDGYVRVTWDPVSFASAYTVYWGTLTGVDNTSPNKARVQTNAFIHGGLINGAAPLFYVVAANSTSGESDPSTMEEVSAAPATGAGSTDTLFANQWHLDNTMQGGQGTTGEDINVIEQWNSGNNTSRGEGVRIAIVDDGLEVLHEDLVANVSPGLHKDYRKTDANTWDDNPTGGEHGTSVAGVAAGRDLNDLGVRGVAPRANLVGYNVLQRLTDSNAVDAMTRGSPDVSVSSNSWGASDNTGELAPSDATWRMAIDQELASGRGGKGTIFTWAAGNGANCAQGTADPCIDNANHDGQANYRGVIAVCATGDDGVRAYYSEKGANLWVCAPSEGDNNHAITTTDRSGPSGYNAGFAPDYLNANYTKTFNGTSSATPVVSGAVALLLQAYPNLTWRDVREILATSARKNDASDGDWTTNQASSPFNINHAYGFGVVDVGAALTTASGWTPVGAEATPYTSTLKTVNASIPDDNLTGVSDTITVSSSSITKIEWVEVTLTTNHPYPGDLRVVLTGPGGSPTVSTLNEPRDCYNFFGMPVICDDFNGWVFGVARYLGEPADGDWTLKVSDESALDMGTFVSWRLKIYGR